jgi:CheY-like chemotaxis protein
MRTLLLADDSITVQRVIALTFAEEPISVVTVADGRQAMEKMVAQPPDIVLAGTTLPHVSGYELARFMRSTPELRHVPVLLLSGAFESVDNAQLTSSGANGVLEKPVEPTIVIGRVKELLGLKTESKPATAGRLVTSAGGPTNRRPSAPTPPSVTSTRPAPSQWDQLRDRTGLDANTRSVEDPASRPDDYLDTLDEAFDSLDRQIAGRAPKEQPQQHQRNPSGPLGQSSGAADPRSPGRRPSVGAQGGNPVFEVDDEWFGQADNAARSDARAGRREIVEDLRGPEFEAPPKPDAPAHPIYEVDDEWFIEDEKVKAQRAVEHQQLAAEMGLHDMDLAPVEGAAAPAGADDLSFSLDDLKHLDSAPPPPEPIVLDIPAPLPVAAPAPRTLESTHVIAPPVPIELPKPEPVAAEPVMPLSPIVPMAPIASVVAAPAPGDAAESPMADDFAALLAFEQGEQSAFARGDSGELRRDRAGAASGREGGPPEVRVVTPEITEQMLDQIAARVAERLSASAFGEQLKDAMTSTMRETVRDTVRTVVSETSERLVRDEIERIKSKPRT